METMEAMVKRVISDYPDLMLQKAQFERHLSQRENPDMRDALTMLWVKIHTVENWFALLEADERFVLRQMISEKQSEPAAQNAALMWICQACNMEKTPLQIRKNVIAKITAFAEMHKETMLAIFTEH